MSSRVSEQGQFVKREQPDLSILMKPRAQVPLKRGGWDEVLSARPIPEQRLQQISRLASEQKTALADGSLNL